MRRQPSCRLCCAKLAAMGSRPVAACPARWCPLAFHATKLSSAYGAAGAGNREKATWSGTPNHQQTALKRPDK
jgi:hypothetical protein